jgi:uncharacterized membrane protein
MATQHGRSRATATHGTVTRVDSHNVRGRRDWSGQGDGHWDPERLAAALGWLSVGLGATALLVPGTLTRGIGLRGGATSRTIARLVGVRELASGVGILSERRPATWVWSRVVGDAMDLAVLISAFAAPRVRRGRLGVATAAVAGIAALDARCAQQLSGLTRVSTGSLDGRTVRARKRIIVNRPPETLYGFWRDFANLPRIMQDVESVRVMDTGRSHWRARGPGGVPIEWDAEVTEDRPDELIAWRTVDGTALPHTGVIRFEPAPGGRGTMVTLEMRYTPPGGAVSAAAAKLIGYAPEQRAQDDLRRLKQLMETGQVVVSESLLHGVARPQDAERRRARSRSSQGGAR